MSNLGKKYLNTSNVINKQAAFTIFLIIYNDLNTSNVINKLFLQRI